MTLREYRGRINSYVESTIAIEQITGDTVVLGKIWNEAQMNIKKFKTIVAC